MKKAKIGSKLYILLIMLFLYAPIAVFIVLSFNSANSAVMQGFSFKWYGEVFEDRFLMEGLSNSLLVAVLAAFFSTILGTVASIGMYNFKGAPRRIFQTVSNIPIINPEIVTGFSLLLFFTFIGRLLNFEMGFVTVLLAHIGFCTPYVILSVTPKLRQMDKHIYEAALDLGCNQFQAFFKVVIFELLPGILSGFLISFTYSLDDFVISYFTRGAQFQTLPIVIYNNMRKPVYPKVGALSTMLFVVIFTVLIIVNIRNSRALKKEQKL